MIQVGDAWEVKDGVVLLVVGPVEERSCRVVTLVAGRHASYWRGRSGVGGQRGGEGPDAADRIGGPKHRLACMFRRLRKTPYHGVMNINHLKKHLLGGAFIDVPDALRPGMTVTVLEGAKV